MFEGGEAERDGAREVRSEMRGAEKDQAEK